MDGTRNRQCLSRRYNVSIMAKRHSTSTICADGSISPWLGASGPLAYSPENHPETNYFFQYGWLMPSLFPDRRHYYFGYWSSMARRDTFDNITIEFLVDFWAKSQAGRVIPVIVRNSYATSLDFGAPIACYQYRRPRDRTDSYMLMQHGSYQTVPGRKQPHLHEGKIIVYRGIGKAAVFKHFCPDKTAISETELRSLKHYWVAHQKAFADSEVSFSVAHSRIHRSETDFLNINYDWSSIAHEEGLDWTGCEFARLLRASYLQSFTLDQQIAKNKFGPNYAAFLTPIENIRLTTFFAGEQEVFILDPSKMEIIKAYGCKTELITGRR